LPPGFVSLDYRPYRYAFAAYMLMLHALNLWLCTRLLRRPAADSGTRLRHIACGSLAYCAAVGTVFVTRMDHAVVTSTLLVIWAFGRAQGTTDERARVRWAAACGALAALGVMLKLVPGLAGAAAVLLWLRSDARDRLRLSLVCALVGATTLVGINLAMYGLAGPAYAATFRYHALRGVQLESTYAGLIMLLKPFGMAMHIDESFGSTNLASAATELVKQLSPWLLLVGMAYLLGLRRFAADARGALLLTCALLLTFMLTNRVFSPQYLMWIGAPLCALYAEDTVTKRGYLLFLVSVLLSQLIFPRGYPLLKAFHPLGIFLLDVRNISLVVLTIGLVRRHSDPVRFQSARA
jgi:4-amino-4-deoxy-L-arabinose transferase-like glycosyltransferase